MSNLQEIQAAAERVAARVVREDKVPISYTLDLALEGLSALSRLTGEPKWKAHVDSVAARRGWTSETLVPWGKEPFACISWNLAKANNDRAALDAFVEESRKEKEEIWRSEDGLILHPRGEVRGGGFAVLIDSFAQYVSRMGRAAALTGDSAYADEAAEQTVRHRDLLRSPVHGLWAQGRGWVEKDKPTLSPGAWSRGQGWLMKGFAEALDGLPRDSAAYGTIQRVMLELADALLPRQDGSGLWRALPHRGLEESSIEISGSSLIAGALLSEHLPGDTYKVAGWKAIGEVVKHVDGDGLVHDACYGPGPLEQEKPWQVQQFPPGDSHGAGTVLAALTAAMRVHK